MDFRCVSLAATIAVAVAFPAHAGMDEAADAARRGDSVAAMRLALPLADNGDVRAMKLLGSLFLSGGNGLLTDPLRAMQYFRRAAERGDADSQFALGKGYAEGTGQLRSPNQAYYWLSVATENAPADKREAWKQERDLAGRSLTSGEIEAARDQALRFLGREPPPAAPPPPAFRQNAPLPIIEKPAPPKALRTSAGSGIVITGGKVLTNAHVVAACKGVHVTFASGSRIEAQIAARDDKDDLALLDTPRQEAEAIRFRDGKPVRAGDGVVVVGFPLSTMLSREANVTTGTISALAGSKGDNRFLQITAPVQKGNSGGPLADMNGHLVGIVASKLDAMKIAERTGDLPQNVNFAIKTDVARKFLTANSVTVQTAASDGPPLSAADVGEMIKRVTVFVECKQ